MGCGSSQVAAEPYDFAEGKQGPGGGGSRHGTSAGGSRRGGLKVSIVDSPSQHYGVAVSSGGKDRSFSGLRSPSATSAASPFAISALDGIARVASLRLGDDDDDDDSNPLAPLPGSPEGAMRDSVASTSSPRIPGGTAGGRGDVDDDDNGLAIQLPGRALSSTAAVGGGRRSSGAATAGGKRNISNSQASNSQARQVTPRQDNLTFLRQPFPQGPLQSLPPCPLTSGQLHGRGQGKRRWGRRQPSEKVRTGMWQFYNSRMWQLYFGSVEVATCMQYDDPFPSALQPFLDRPYLPRI